MNISEALIELRAVRDNALSIGEAGSTIDGDLAIISNSIRTLVWHIDRLYKELKAQEGE